jgi:hypothetical protein
MVTCEIELPTLEGDTRGEGGMRGEGPHFGWKSDVLSSKDSGLGFYV